MSRLRKGPYGGREDYTLHTKVAFRLPLTPAETEEYRAYQHCKNRTQWAKQGSTIEGRARQLFRAAKKRADNAGLAFTITPRFIEDRLKKGICERSGINFDFGPSETHTNKFAPSIDRIDPSKGYTPENSRLVIAMYNFCKGQYSDKDVEAFALAVVKRMFVERCEAEGL